MRIRMIHRWVTALALAATLVGGGSVAWAVETTTTPTVVDANVEIQLWMGAGPSQAVAIVSVLLPESQALPAKVRLPLLEGMQVDWAGEVSGGDPASDPPRQFEVVDGPKGGRYAEFVVEQYRMAQIDLSAVPHTEEGDRVSASFDFVEPLGTAGTIFSVRLPAIASDVDISPKPSEKPNTNELGESLYTLKVTKLAAGEKATVDVAYTADMGKLDGASGGDTFGIVIGVLAGIAVVALVLVVVMLMRQRGGTAAADELDEE